MINQPPTEEVRLATREGYEPEENHNHRHAEEEKPGPITNVYPLSVYKITVWPIAWPPTITDFASFHHRQSNFKSVT